MRIALVTRLATTVPIDTAICVIRAVNYLAHVHILYDGKELESVHRRRY